ncbi:hypothetical protein DM826_05635 [Halonotius aquaticus]|uniref:DUF1102 domain-containing protein n=2 Tax=Halonotius aquaticus TaxID=2216978 RepID=A0A3A6Q3C1_9EURY|nr:hypothetical protein DM826_05635 [Halonotius aquaticus]
MIIGLGTLAAGAGVIGGSGAFDSVEADRSVEISVAGDASALLKLDATNSTVAQMKNGIIYFQLNEELGESASVNDNATTKFKNAFKITNNGPDQTVSVRVITPENLNGLRFILSDERDAANPTDLTVDSVNLAQGESESVDLWIMTGTDGYEEPAADEAHQITIRAAAVE